MWFKPKQIGTDDSSIQNQKNILSKVLARENVKIEWTPRISTASINLEKRIIHMPIWKAVSPELVDMLCLHETGHALETKIDPSKMLPKIVSKTGAPLPLVKTIWNVIEDVRINELQKRRYPGSRYDFVVGYQERYDRGDYGGHVDFINNLSFIDRINVYFKVGAHIGVNFSKEEIPLRDKIGKVMTEEEVLELIEETIEFLKNNPESGKSPQFDPDNFEFGDDDGESEGETIEIEMNFDSDESDNGDNEKDESEENSDESKDGKNSKEDMKAKKDSSGSSKEQTEKQSKSSTAGAGGKKGGKSSEKKKLAMLAAMIIGQSVNNEEKSTEKYVDNRNKMMLEPQAYSLNKVTIGWKSLLSRSNSRENSFWNFQKENQAAINLMVSQFEMKKQASSFQRSLTAKTGLLDMNKVYNYKLTEDLFKKSTINKDGKNHGFIFLIDTSGSMSDTLNLVLKQLLLFSMFTRRLGVPFAAYSFTDNGYGGNAEGYPSRFNLIEVLSSNMKKDEFAKVAGFIIDNNASATGYNSSGGTPLNGSIMATSHIANEFLKKNPVDILNFVVMTDGEAGDIFNGHTLINSKTGKMYPAGGNHTNLSLEYFKDTVNSAFPATKLNIMSFDLMKSNNRMKEIIKNKKKNMPNYNEVYILPIESLTKPKDINRAGIDEIDVVLSAQNEYRAFLRNFAEKVAATA